MKQLAENGKTATLGGGCFWCLEAIFQRLEGVESVVSGYAGGSKENPTYEEVCSETTGHAEVVRITFDPAVVSYEGLLEVFFKSHDPTTKDRQGNDVGHRYRSIILYHSEEQREAAESLLERLGRDGEFAAPLVTEVEPCTAFYPAEEYHQNYFNRNPGQPYCTFVVAPKVEKFMRKFGGRS